MNLCDAGTRGHGDTGTAPAVVAAPPRPSYPVLCSWCELYRPGLEPNVTNWTTVPRSSGICPECKLRALAEAGLDDQPQRTQSTRRTA